MTTSSAGPDRGRRAAGRSPTAWVALAVGVTGLVVVAACLLTAWSAIVHGHPAYAALLSLSAVGSAVLAWGVLRQEPSPDEPTVPSTRWRVLQATVLVLAGSWIAATAWLRPASAVEPALTALVPDATVGVVETAARIELIPSGSTPTTGLLYQPARGVDPRAYAATLRPVAEAGHLVVIVKPPLGIAPLAKDALENARRDHPEVDRWVVGGHGLGGSVAAEEAVTQADDDGAPVVALLLHASSPGEDLSSLRAEVLSVSGSEDGLTTPATIEASMDHLPPSARFLVIEGAVHAFFADYGPQRGDGTPTIPRDDARSRISEATARFVDAL